MKMFRKVQMFLQFVCNKSDNNLDITFVRTSLDLGKKKLNWKTIYRFSPQEPRSRFFIFATREL